MVSGLEGSPTYTRIQVLQTTSTWPARWTPDTLQLTDEQSNELTGATTNQPSDSCPSPVTVYSDTLHRSGRLSRSTTEDREDTPTPHTARYRPTNLWNALKTGARRNTGDYTPEYSKSNVTATTPAYTLLSNQSAQQTTHKANAIYQ